MSKIKDLELENKELKERCTNLIFSTQERITRLEKTIERLTKYKNYYELSIEKETELRNDR